MVKCDSITWTINAVSFRRQRIAHYFLILLTDFRSDGIAKLIGIVDIELEVDRYPCKDEYWMPSKIID